MASHFRWFSGILWMGLCAVALGQQPETTILPLDEATLPEVLVRPSLEPSEPDTPSTETPPDFSPVFTSPFSRTLQTGGLDEKRLFDLPGLATVRTRQRIEEMGPLTTPEALQEEVGVLIQRTNLGGGSVFVRGLTGNQVLILVDGIRLNNSTFRGPTSSSTPTSRLSSTRKSVTSITCDGKARASAGSSMPTGSRPVSNASRKDAAGSGSAARRCGVSSMTSRRRASS